MAAPDQNIPQFTTGEKLTAARLDQLRTTIAALVDAWQARFGPIDGAAARSATYGIFTSNAPATDRDGVSTGSLCVGTVVPSASGLTESSLGEKATSPDESDVSNVEVWDAAILGHRVGHFAGIASDGKPLMIVAGGVSNLVTITGNSTRPGVYTGYVRRPVKQRFDPGGTGLLNGNSINEFGEPPSDTSEIYILNAAEEGTNTHALTDAAADVSKTHVGVLMSMTATDGKPVWVINGSTSQTCPT